MAFGINSLRAVADFPSANAGSRGGSLMAYQTNDTIAEVAGAGYFNDATTYLVKGDILLVSADIDGTPATAQYVVSSETDAAVVVVTAAA